MAATPIGPGSLLANRFRLDDLLEDAAGARFWRASDLVLNRSVAVHVLDRTDPRAASLVSAARASASVSDPRLLRVLDVSEEQGSVYVVHEWGSGTSLNRLVAEEPLPPRRAAWVTKEVAEAVTTAHRHGLAHGRLIPENVLVTESGAVKLVGFAIDAVLHPETAPDPVADGRDDQAADVVALGGLLYASLVARWPGPGSSLPPAPADHGRVLRPRQVRAGVPRPLDLVCDRLLNHAPAPPGARALDTAGRVRNTLCDFLGEHHPAEFADLPAGPGSGPAAGVAPGNKPGPTTRNDDPEATQAGVPLFHDFDSGVGWLAAVPKNDVDSTPTAGPTSPVPGFAGQPPFTGMGAGSLPSVWGPDPRVPVEPVRPPSDPTGTRWLRPAALVAVGLLLVFAVVVALTIDRSPRTPASPSPGPGGSPSAADDLPIRSVFDFDPLQQGRLKEENPESVSLAVDGDPATAWGTLRYRDGPVLAPYKAGVGLVVDLGSEQAVSSVHLELLGSPYDLQLLAAAADAARPTDLSELGVVAEASDTGTTVELRPDRSVTTRYLVIWLTALPADRGGFRGQIAEIVVRS